MIGLRGRYEIDRLAQLVHDLRAYTLGQLPDPDELAKAPRLDDWRLGYRTELSLHGTTTDHPELIGSRNITTSALFHLDAQRSWARTYGRLYRLGTARGDHPN